MRINLKRIVIGLAVVFVLGIGVQRTSLAADKPPAVPGVVPPVERPFGLPKRIPWTKSRLTGSPEPQHPYRTERLFPKLKFADPLLCTLLPGTNRILVGEQAGKVYSFLNQADADKTDLFIDLTKELKSLDPKVHRGVSAIYGLAFHPKYEQNRYCYVCYIVNGSGPGELQDGSRVSRFAVTKADPPRLDPASEKIVFTFPAGGHNGGCLEFGNDGYLYISTGDGTGPNPPDGLNTGQDTSDFLSSILRIDVDHEDNGKAYKVPPDNPFVATEGTRPEIWSFGYRNPWKMTFDRATGDLWVGDVGWELWEMVYRVKRGGNYGWSVMEGPQEVKPAGKRGPTPILPATIEFPHSEAASITGGYVYRGKQYTDLIGAYICGDYATGRMWATTFDGEKIRSHREIARTGHRIVAYGEFDNKELFYLHHDPKEGAFFRLVPQDTPDTSADFPRKLSETGLFSDTAAQVPEAGVIPFLVNVPQWSDHATGERWVAMPGTSSIKLYPNPVTVPNTYFPSQMHFPKDGVLAKTLSLEMERGKPESKRKIETQVLLNDGREWFAYTYQWNDAQTDATLVGASGAEKTLDVKDAQAPGGHRKQTWRFHSRTECLRCHNPWTGGNLAFNTLQLDRDQNYGGVVDNQLRSLQHADIISPVEQTNRRRRFRRPRQELKLVDPYDHAADLNLRARSYLHVNCSFCHQNAAGGSTTIDLRGNIPLSEAKSLSVRPSQGTFNIPGAQVIAPADPYRSVLYYRLAKLGSGHMPHIGSQLIDEEAVRLVHDWIRQLPVRPEEATLLDRLRTPDETPGGAATAKTTDPQAEQRAKERAAARTEALGKLLASPSGALLLTHAIDSKQLTPAQHQQVVQAGAGHADPLIRDLFERFVPDEQRVKRLGAVIKPEAILALKGDAARGKALFFATGTVQCKNCHRIAGEGSTLGPDLSAIGKKLDRARILENILEPSKTMEPQYVPYLLETKDGQFHTGLLAEKSAAQVVLRDAADKTIRVPTDKVEALVPQKNSIMPDLQLRDLTAAQVADLIAYLESLK